MQYHPKVGAEHSTGYIKTLIKTNDLLCDLEKMEFLSNVLTNPNLEFYAVTPDVVKKVDRKYKVVLEKSNKKK